ncbi:MAG: hypothetical protein L6Q95_17625, partial [Planctomycetes bacterium]|nr:hypothetical protein [Planctomycetota bacterium]
PCIVRVDGDEVLRLAEPPRPLTGVIGDVPPGLADAVEIRPVALAAGSWRALDLFDRLLVTGPVRGDEPWFGTVAQWVLAGGSLAAEGARRLFPEGTGLGAAAERIDDLPLPRIPAPGNVRPDVYALLRETAGRSPPLRAARWIVLGAAVAMALQILLAMRGRMRMATLALGILAVALLGAVAGLLRTRADYTPVARGRIEVSWRKDGVERVRTYLVYREAGPEASAPRAPEAAPVLFGSNRTPWWRGPGEEAAVGEGITRIFLVEEVRRAPGTPSLPSGEPPGDLWERERPRRGGVRAGATPVSPPEAALEAPLLLAVGAVVQD